MMMSNRLRKFLQAVSLAAVAVFAVSPASAQTRAYVTNNASQDVSVIDTATNTVTATIPLGDRPLGLAVTPDGAFVYVAMTGSSVSVIDTATHTVVATVPSPFPRRTSPSHRTARSRM